MKYGASSTPLSPEHSHRQTSMVEVQLYALPFNHAVFKDKDQHEFVGHFLFQAYVRSVGKDESIDKDYLQAR